MPVLAKEPGKNSKHDTRILQKLWTRLHILQKDELSR